MIARAILFVALVLGAAASARAADASSGAIRIVDDRGRAVRFEGSPKRIVSLLPSLTESACALDACDRLVGTDRYSNHPAAVRALPKLGGGIDPDVEAVLRLKPDVVLAAGSSRVVERLESLGVPVLAFEPHSIAGARAAFLAIGVLVGATDAAARWSAIEADVDRAGRSLPPAARGLRVYIEVGGGGWAAGRTSFMGELLTRLGADNIVPAALGPFPKLAPEFVVRADPQVILTSDSGSQGLESRPGWRRIDAVKRGHVCRFDADENDMLVRPGPRLADAARLMAVCLARGTNDRADAKAPRRVGRP